MVERVVLPKDKGFEDMGGGLIYDLGFYDLGFYDF
jgi:hypothetical protein